MTPIRSIAAGLSIGAACAVMADGGAPIASVRRGDATFTLVVSPVPPAVGAVEFHLLGPVSTRATITLREIDEPPQVLAFPLEADAAGRSVRTSLDRPGECRFEVRLDGDPTRLLEGVVPVQPNAGPWIARLPWALAWLPVAAVLALRAMAFRARGVPYTRPHAR